MGTKRTVRKEERELLDMQGDATRGVHLRAVGDVAPEVHQQAQELRGSQISSGEAMRVGRYVQSDLAKLAILETCVEPMTSQEIAKRMGRTRASVSQHLQELGDHVIRDTSVSPGLYKANPNKCFVPKVAPSISELRQMKQVAEEGRTFPILPQGPLSFLKECERYELVIKAGQRVSEKHNVTESRKYSPHIGNGSCALMEMAV